MLCRWAVVTYDFTAKMVSHLKGRIDLSILRESFRRELLECLDKCVGTKVKVVFPLQLLLLMKRVWYSMNTWAIIQGFNTKSRLTVLAMLPQSC